MKRTGLVLLALILVGGLVFAAGCITAPQTQSLEGNWILTGIGSNSTVENPTGIISMEIAGTNVSGNAGVNSYHGTITIEDGKVTFGPSIHHCKRCLNLHRCFRQRASDLCSNARRDP